ncbi:MAG: GTPase Era [Flavobacteriaceae bacterium]
MGGKHFAGFVSIVGNPNVGKSTLMNALLGEKLSIITSKAQTTRHRILGILNGEDYQLVLSDTPGIIKPAYAMQDAMMHFVKESLVDADVICYMTTAEMEPLKDEKLKERIQKTKTPLLILINKVDLTEPTALHKAVDQLNQEFPDAEILPISAKTSFCIPELLEKLRKLIPESPPYFPKDQLTDKPERFFVNEAIRQSILEHYSQEIPYAVEVTTEEFKEDSKIIRIRAIIQVERNSQKGILIGHRGAALKKLGITARKSLETFFGKKIHLELYVKVVKNWRSNNQQLKRFGYSNQ